MIMPPDSSKHEHAKATTECPEASSPGVAAQPTCPVRNGTNADNADNKHKQLFRKRCRAHSIDYDLEHDTCSTTNSSHIHEARASLSPPSGRGLARWETYAPITVPVTLLAPEQSNPLATSPRQAAERLIDPVADVAYSPSPLSRIPYGRGATGPSARDMMSQGEHHDRSSGSMSCANSACPGFARSASFPGQLVYVGVMRCG